MCVLYMHMGTTKMRKIQSLPNFKLNTHERTYVKEPISIYKYTYSITTTCVTSIKRKIRKFGNY